MDDLRTRIESETDVWAYLQNLRYALENDATITFQAERQVDQNRDQRYTNKFTIADLFPDENPVEALRRELKQLTIEEYIRTVKDLRFPKKSEMRRIRQGLQRQGRRVYQDSGGTPVPVREPYDLRDVLPLC